MAAEFRAVLETLERAGVRFVLIGGLALVFQGSARTTGDVDICYARDAGNLGALAAALAPLHPRLRGAPAKLPFRLDAATLERGLNFTLTTDLGDLDLLGEIAGLGGFARVAAQAEPMMVYGRKTAVLSLEGLERAKRASGRIRDLLDLAEIAEIRRLRGEQKKEEA